MKDVNLRNAIYEAEKSLQSAKLELRKQGHLIPGGPIKYDEQKIAVIQTLEALTRAVRMLVDASEM